MAIAIEQLQGLKDQTKNFRGLMNLYEDNYIRFKQLVGELDTLEDETISQRIGDVDLHLQVLERCKYTTTVLLTYRFQSEEGEIRSPDLKIRLYQDARQAEVMSCCQHDKKRFQWLERASCQSNIQWRWRMNHFLFKWLNYCLKSGHSFPQENSGINWSSFLNTV